MNASNGRGWNPIYGLDSGAPPPTGKNNGFQTFPSFPIFPSANVPPPQLVFPPPYTSTSSFPGFQNFNVSSGWGGYGQPHPAPAPSIPTNPPAGYPNVHLRNHTGGVGLPPGYDYAFPKEHCKIHVFKTTTPPWQFAVSAWEAHTHSKLYVPCNTTVKELMQNLGCTNEDPKKNKMYEVQEVGSGKWSKGLTFSGDQKDKVKKMISEYGWDGKRTGHAGERPVVWLYCTKD